LLYSVNFSLDLTLLICICVLYPCMHKLRGSLDYICELMISPKFMIVLSHTLEKEDGWFL
jgi:hypothetical protein